MLRETSLLLRRIAPLGIIVIIVVSVGILFLLFLSWLGEVLFQIPIHDSVSAFFGNAILLSAAFALLGPLLSERVLSHGAVKAKTQPSPTYELVPQLDLRVKEAEKTPKEKGILERLKDRLETDEKRHKWETHLWEDKPETSRESRIPVKEPLSKLDFIWRKTETAHLPTSPSELSKREGAAASMERTETKSTQSVETGRPADAEDASQETSEVQQPLFVPPERLAVRIEQMSFNCSFCGKATSLPWEKVQESQNGAQLTVDCPRCQKQYPFNYDLAEGKMLSGKITAA